MISTSHKLIVATALLAAALLAVPGCTASAGDRKTLAGGYQAYQARRYDDAEAAATTYIQKVPNADNLDEAYYLRGLARLGRQDKGGAAQDLTLAISKSKRKDLQAKAYRTLGDIAYDGQLWDDARRHYANALAAGGAGETAYLELRIGEILQAQGRWDEAKPHLDKSASLGERSAAERAPLRYFTLQFGSFADVANANTLARQLNASGMGAGVFPEKRGNATLFAVRAGGYATLAAAESARGAILARWPLATVFP